MKIDKVEYDFGSSMFDPETKWQILNMYIEGMSVQDISGWMGIPDREINLILDSITPSL